MRLIALTALGAVTLSGCGFGIVEQYRQQITVDGEPHEAICSVVQRDTLQSYGGPIYKLLCRVRVGQTTAQCEIVDLLTMNDRPPPDRVAPEVVTNACTEAVRRAVRLNNRRDDDDGDGGYSPPDF